MITKEQYIEAKRIVSEYKEQQEEIEHKGVENDLGHGKCVEKNCDRWAVIDYNGRGHWNCKPCYDRNERYFEEEYR